MSIHPPRVRRAVMGALLTLTVAVAVSVAVSVAADRAAHAQDAAPASDLDMRILTTPADVRFDVDIGKLGQRYRAKPLRGAKGWAVRLGTRKMKSALWPTPATDGERIYVGGPLESSEFFAMHADTGGLAWRRSLADAGPTPAVVRDRRVYFNTQSCTVYAYDGPTGNRVWSRYLAGHVEAIPAVTETAVLSTRPSRHEAKVDANLPALTVMDPRRGTILANVTIDAEALGGPVVSGNRAFVATRLGTVFCIDTEKGETRWKHNCGARSAPWLDESGLFVVGREAIESYHPETGFRRFADAAITPSSRDAQPITAQPSPPRVRRSAISQNGEGGFWKDASRPVVAAERLVLAEGRTLRVFDRVTGAEQAWWEIDVDHPFSGSPVVAGDTVVVATSQGQVRAIDVTQGEIVWALDIDAQLASGFILDASKLYAMTTDGRLLGIETGDLRADGWPMWGGSPTHAFEELAPSDDQ